MNNANTMTAKLSDHQKRAIVYMAKMSRYVERSSVDARQKAIGTRTLARLESLGLAVSCGKFGTETVYHGSGAPFGLGTYTRSFYECTGSLSPKGWSVAAELGFDTGAKVSKTLSSLERSAYLWSCDRPNAPSSPDEVKLINARIAKIRTDFAGFLPTAKT